MDVSFPFIIIFQVGLLYWLFKFGNRNRIFLTNILFIFIFSNSKIYSKFRMNEQISYRNKVIILSMLYYVVFSYFTND